MPTTTKPIQIELIALGKVNSFIEDLEEEEQLTSYSMIKLLENPPYESGGIKIVNKSHRIYEVRGSTKDFWIRHFWFYHKIPHENRSIIVITNSCIKKQNKTDPDEIKIAVKIKDKFEAVKKEEYKKLKKTKKAK